MNTTQKKVSGKSNSSKKKELDSLINLDRNALIGNTIITIDKDKLNKNYLFKIPQRKQGIWSVTFREYTQKAKFFEQATMFAGDKFRYSNASVGDKIVMLKKAENIMMSLSEAELSDHYDFFLYHMHGNILINGLGLGIIPYLLDKEKAVKSITIYENNVDVISLVADTLLANTKKVTIVCRDAFSGPEKGKVFDYVWHDIWPDICSDNIEEMHTLESIYRPSATDQGFWAQEICLYKQAEEAIRNKRLLTRLR